MRITCWGPGMSRLWSLSQRCYRWWACLWLCGWSHHRGQRWSSSPSSSSPFPPPPHLPSSTGELGWGQLERHAYNNQRTRTWNRKWNRDTKWCPILNMQVSMKSKLKACFGCCKGEIRVVITVTQNLLYSSINCCLPVWTTLNKPFSPVLCRMCVQNTAFIISYSELMFPLEEHMHLFTLKWSSYLQTLTWKSQLRLYSTLFKCKSKG